MRPKSIKELYDMHLIPDTQMVELWGWEICWDETDGTEFEDCATLITAKWKDVATDSTFSSMFIAEDGITTDKHSELLQIEVF